MGPEPVVEPEEVVSHPSLGPPDADIGFQVHLIVIHFPPQPLNEEVVRVPLLPSMLTLTPRACSTCANSQLVYKLPWSVLNTSGCLWCLGRRHRVPR